MSQDWNTKYGPRRVRRDPPTLEEAIFAAAGITDDQNEQADRVRHGRSEEGRTRLCAFFNPLDRRRAGLAALGRGRAPGGQEIR
jgi:hypothetical protein